MLRMAGFIPGFGRSRCYQLVETAGSARNAYEMPDSDIAFTGCKKKHWQYGSSTVKLKERNALYETCTCIRESLMYIIKARSIHRSCEIFQIRLFGIYYKGSFPDSAYPAVANDRARKI